MQCPDSCRDRIVMARKLTSRAAAVTLIASDSEEEIVVTRKRPAKESKTKGRKRDGLESEFSEDELALEDPRSDVWKGRKDSFAVVVPPRTLSQTSPSQNIKAGLKASDKKKGRRVTGSNVGRSCFHFRVFIS